MSWDELFNHPMLSDPHKLDEKEHKFEIDKETQLLIGKIQRAATLHDVDVKTLFGTYDKDKSG